MRDATATDELKETRRGPRYREIIDAAIEVFSLTNYENATTALIAAEAGVAEGTLYKYFPSKKELFFECFRHVQRQLIERYAKIYEQTRDDPAAYLRETGRSFFEFLRENPNKRRFLAFVLNNAFDTEFRDELESFYAFHVRAAERMIRRAIELGQLGEDVNPRLAAWIFVGGYFTLILMFELDAREFQQEDIMDDIMRFLLR